MKRLSLLAVAALAFAAFASGEDGLSESEKRAATIRYGIESQVVDLLTTLRAEKDDSLKSDILDAFDASTSTKLRSAILEYLAALELSDADERAAGIVAERDSNAEAMVTASLSYLRALKSKAALDEAAEIVADDEGPYLQAAIKYIGAAGTEKQAEALRAAYEADGASQSTKEAVVQALGSLRSVESFDLLSSVASSDESSKAIRMYACSALGELGDDRAVPVLVVASVSPDPNVRAAAVEALGEYSGADALSAVRQALRDSHALPRIAAAKAAGQSRDAEALPYLEYKASYDPEKAVREASIAALAKIGGPRADDYLSAFVAETKNGAQYRSAALKAILSDGGGGARKKALEAFAAAQADKDRALFTAFAKAAMSVDDEAAAPFAELMLGDKDYSMRLGALAWIERNRYAALAGAVRSVSETDASDAVKKRAAKALERLAP
ncbi:MAG TPA: HEAT repeat domain-containing protein [Spirochaetia bacterium]|nr:HEAT repeat domain-containing protein [Spirochaetales bacterium]HRW25381.1 HEAT repeat domain-containing protein [Spirochaetia bacterium]